MSDDAGTAVENLEAIAESVQRGDDPYTVPEEMLVEQWITQP